MIPTFSIIIPTYNSEDTLKRCLESIRCQTFKNFEVLIVDGVSLDKTLEIVKSFNDDRIKILSEKDEGIYDAMNKGIGLANGDWLYFLGSDDYFHDKNVLSDVYSVLKNCEKPILYGSVLISGKANWATNGSLYDGEFDLKKILVKNICHQSIFYNAKFLNKNNLFYKVKYRYLADWDFNIKCFSLTNFQYMDRCIAVFNAGGASTKTATQIDPFYSELLMNFLVYFKLSAFSKKVKYLSPVFLKELNLFRKKESKVKYIFYKLLNL